MEPYLSIYTSKINSIISSQIDLSVLNAIYDFQRYTPVVAGDTITYIESPYYKDPAFDMIDTDTKDLCLWTDPIAMLSMAKDIRDWLISYYPDDQKIFEVWTELLPVRDWVALEQMWSQANSSKNPGEIVDFNITTP
jgi:hypothetical protein